MFGNYDTVLPAIEMNQIYTNNLLADGLLCADALVPAVTNTGLTGVGYTNVPISSSTEFTYALGNTFYINTGFAQASTNVATFYQWQLNGTNLFNGPSIRGATSNILSFTVTSLAQSGTFTLMASNAFGTTILTAGTLNVLPITGASEVVDATSMTWKYWTNGTNPGSNWNQIGFNDSAWPGGLGLFGFASPGIWPDPFQTTIKAPAEGGPITSYFLTTFTWDGATNDVNLVSTNYIEDGAVFYLNGREVGRYNVPLNQDYLTLATDPVVNPGHPETITFPPGSLVSGTNLLGVELHASSTASTNDVLGMELTANVSVGALPMMNITRTAGNFTVTWSGYGTLQATTNLLAPWSNVPAASPYTFPGSNGDKFFRLREP